MLKAPHNCDQVFVFPTRPRPDLRLSKAHACSAKGPPPALAAIANQGKTKTVGKAEELFRLDPVGNGAGQARQASPTSSNGEHRKSVIPLFKTSEKGERGQTITTNKQTYYIAAGPRLTKGPNTGKCSRIIIEFPPKGAGVLK